MAQAWNPITALYSIFTVILCMYIWLLPPMLSFSYLLYPFWKKEIADTVHFRKYEEETVGFSEGLKESLPVQGPAKGWTLSNSPWSPPQP